MANISDNVIGVDLTNKVTPNAASGALFKTGQTVRGDDGSLYQYARASTAIAASNAAVNITVSGDEYVAANTGGSSTSPPVSMASGDFAFFKLA